MKKMKLKKNILIILLALIILSVIFVISFQKDKKTKITLNDEELEKRLSSFEANVQSGGPPKDGIPPIENPRYVSIEEADKMLDDNDVVFIVESEDGIYIYPQKILVWHEIVNEKFSGEMVSITYCPLTGSAIGFKGSLSTGETTFGTSGKLLNSNLVMYDRTTKSYWPQILGIAIKGELKGESLEEFPVIWTRWKFAKVYYKKAEVLSENTGFIRDYNKDPYGSYLEQNNYYDSGRPFFPVMQSDKRFDDKEVMIAGRLNGSPFALLKRYLSDKKIIQFEIDKTPLIAVYDPNLDTARIFKRTIAQKDLSFKIRDGKIIDEKSNSIWDERGKAIDGELKGTQLEFINSFNVMWFAWYAFEPETEVFE